MSEEFTRFDETPRDLEHEITELEFEATQRRLTQEEVRNLQELRENHETLTRAARERSERKRDGADVEMRGDDSP